MANTLRQRVLQGLILARGFVARGWTQGWFARNSSGVDCASTNAEACCWCVSGAIGRSTNNDEEFNACFREMELTTNSKSLVSWNDAKKRKQAHVVKALDTTIRRLKAQEARSA